MSNFDSQRRQLLKASLLAGGLAATGSLLSIDAFAAGKANVNLQLGWLAGGNQIGEVVAKRIGYYDAGRHQPGDPARRPQHRRRRGRRVRPLRSRPGLVQPVAHAGGVAGHAGQVLCRRRRSATRTASSRCKKNPVRKPADMVGKKVGIQPTGMVLLRALLAKNKIAEKDVKIIPIGADMTPLMTGQVDVVTGWLTNTTALKVLGTERVDLRLWDSGVRLYALPYYATVKTMQTPAARCCRSSCARPRAAGATPTPIATRPSTC